MKLLFNKENLKKSLSIINKGTVSKSIIEISDFILIEAEKNIKLTSFDQSLSIITYVEGNIEKEGSLCVNEKLFSNIVSKMPGEDITIEKKDNRVVIKSQDVKYEIEYKKAEEFPEVLDIKKENVLDISESLFKDMIKTTIFSANNNGMNEITNGVCIKQKEDLLSVITIDGSRLAIRNEKVSTKDNKEFVVNSSVMNKIIAILEDDSEQNINIYKDSKKVIFELDKTKIICSLMDGSFINVDSIINYDYETKVSINRRELLESIERSTILSTMPNEGKNVPIILNIREGEIYSTINNGKSSMEQTVQCNVEGENITIGFTPGFLIDALRVIKEEEINLFLQNPKTAVYIKDEKESYLYLIMPQNI